MSSEFEKLASDLETLAKASGETDKKIAATAEAAGVNPDDYKEDDGAASGDAKVADDKNGCDSKRDEDCDDEDEMLGKSFSIKTAEGENVRAYDATALIKSLTERLGALESADAEERERREHLGKSLELMTSLIKSQSEQIAALTEKVSALGAEGRGRKAVLSVTEKPTPLAKSEQDGIPASDFMAKAIAAQQQGRITAMDVSIAESALNRGMAVPERIVTRVMGNQ